MLLFVFIANVLTHGKIKHPGEAEYINTCSQCHGEKGEGIQSLVPPLTDTQFLKQNIDSIPCWLIKGMNHKIEVGGKFYEQPMYPSNLTDIQIANLVNYIFENYADTAVSINSAWVLELREKCN